MVLLIISTLALLSLGCDLWVWYLLHKKSRRSPYAQPLYLLSALLLYGSCAYLLINSSGDPIAPVRLSALVWVVALGVITLIPKVLYIKGCLFDSLRSRCTRRPSRVGVRVGLSIGGVLLAILLWSMFPGRTQFRVEEVVIRSEKIGSNLNGVRIVHFSDLHLGSMGFNSNYPQRLVEAINDLHPDVVIFSGDMVNISHLELTPKYQTALSQINAPMGVYSVVGNHDLGYYLPPNATLTPQQTVDTMLLKQRAMGWVVLENETLTLGVESDSLTLTGVGYPADKSHNGVSSGLMDIDLQKSYIGVGDSLFNLMISHYPLSWESIESTPADLVVAGHVHAMQMKVSVGDWQWSPAKWMYEQWSGLYSHNDRLLYINDGAGYVLYPLRIGTRPELTLCILESK